MPHESGDVHFALPMAELERRIERAGASVATDANAEREESRSRVVLL